MKKSPDDFFKNALGFAIFQAISNAIDRIGPAQIKISKSQIAFWNHRGFAYVWRPGQYVKSGVPAVLSIALHRPLASPRIKQTARPTNNIWMHHIEITRPAQVDEEIISWLREAYEQAPKQP